MSLGSGVALGLGLQELLVRLRLHELLDVQLLHMCMWVAKCTLTPQPHARLCTCYIPMSMSMSMHMHVHVHVACLQPADLGARGLVELGELLLRDRELLRRDRQLLVQGLGLAHLVITGQSTNSSRKTSRNK